MKKIILITLINCISLSIFSQSNYCDKIENELIISKTYLTISYNKENKIPNYVGYYLLPNFLIGDTKRETDFYAETNIPKKYRGYSINYSNSGFDRGHMSPAADWKFSKDAMHDSFSMINICPQRPNLNRTYWKSVEELERNYTTLSDTLFVISGIILKENNKNYIKNRIRIPDQFYKTIIGIKNKKVVLSIGWIFENTNRKQLEIEKRTTIDNIESIINKDLYSNFWFNEKEENKIVINGK